MKRLNRFKRELIDELEGNILSFWAERTVDIDRGGFYGRIGGDNTLYPDSPKGVVMHARILWTFSAAYRLTQKPKYLGIATYAKRFLIDHFYDQEYGGVYWSVDAEGNPLETKKQFYALGFAIYGLSEYHRATDDAEALEYAIKLFNSIEEHSFDSVNDGYIEAKNRQWGEIEDMRLSEKDDNYSKTMNTHLHIIEAYTNLYRVWKSEKLKEQTINLLEIFLEKIMVDNNHLGLFFDDQWREQSRGHYSFGHDIEASWLLLEAALEIGDSNLIERVKHNTELIAEASMEGYHSDGSMFYEVAPDGAIDRERHWWVQAESVVGLFYLYMFYDNENALERALESWEYIKENIVDRENGEWYWSIRSDGTINSDDDKAGIWKCPYHNGRMCLEIFSLIS